MSNQEKPIISVSNLGKKFNSTYKRPRKDGLRDLFGKAKTELKAADKRFKDGAFWALEDVSFEVYRGETLGVIGANGAGKSTLLKILSQIYRPSTGSFYIDGRVSSLLEVGTGFHQDLTGRENIYFNGSLLGMKRSEIDEKYDEIVEFSELSEFIDTPIKHYSSGMRSKLGFSVAVSLDAEVMIIDEALAVGDARFREKALKKMKESAFTGKTVLFVTHSMNFIEESCDRVLYLKDGRVEGIGDTKKTLEKYLMTTQDFSASSAWKNDNSGVSEAQDKRIIEMSIEFLVNGKGGESTANYKDELSVEVSYVTDMKSSDYMLGYSIFDDQNRRLWRQDLVCAKKGRNTLNFKVDTTLLKPGAYHIAADAYINSGKSGKWVVNPKLTNAKASILIADYRKDIQNENKEGLIKPPTIGKNV